ncbi:MAG: cytochrome c biogenesis protein CcsA [Sulfurimonas sp.]|nr:cytochrome c biogenesis protein CcsA [Sulfurimonas sp.]
MKQLLSAFSSMKTTVIMLLIFAFSIGYATIIENDYGTMSAKADIYNTLWFEALLGLLALNLSYNIYKYKMYTLKKAPIFIFHIAFIIILIGAAITRFIGVEGSMHIREGESATTMTSREAYFIAEAAIGNKATSSSQIVYFSKRSANTLSSSLEIEGKKVDISLLEYIPDAVEKIVEDKVNGKAAASLMVTSGAKGEPVILKEGEFFDSGSCVLDFNSGETFNKPIVSLYVSNGEIFMKYANAMKYLKMDDRSTGDLNASEAEPFVGRTLFTYEGTSFVLKEFFPSATTKIVSNPNASSKQPGYDALRFNVSVDGVSKEVLIYGMNGVIAQSSEDIINGVHVHLAYGAQTLQLPFAIKLLDFQLDRYPGSMSPASYASEVILLDKEENLEMPYRIFMNNILEHRGYRFFQASYDQDEQGTVLSVNNDPGTLPSYIGYFLLALGMFWSLFSRDNRFSKLAQKAKKASKGEAASLIAVIALLASFSPSYAEDLDPSLETILSFDRAHAEKFGQLIVQDSGGRMKPLDTLATEILAKVHRSSSLDVGNYKLSADQVILGMMVRPDIYRDIKVIRTKDEAINKLIGAKADATYASFSQFFEDPENMRGYKLMSAVEEAARKEPKHRDKFDKEVLKIDERVNISFMVYTGELLKIWPKQNDLANKWFATIEALQTFTPEDGEALRNIAVAYFTSIDEGLASGDWSKADLALLELDKYQKFYGSEVYPSKNRVLAEVFYNKAQIFERLYPLYLLLGFALLILSFTKILKPAFKIDGYTKATLWLLVLFFLAHTIGLAIRWYISGHAPWSNGYESMIYIGWATVLAGFIFSKRSPMTMASTGILAGLILFVAHLNWMDPQVTNLVPVLNSYWLSIHVSMITGSYGFLGLGALLGFISLTLFILKNEKNATQISFAIKELNSINEMSLMVGLVLLTVGNFLGGVWANESWGRYWGWDPKETWALVTILIYAVVLHLRFIKQVYNDFSFSVISLLAFTSVLMTYFGVNYYLAGLHSYAKGDPVPIPDFVPVTYTIIFLMIVLAYRNRKLV